MDKPFITVPVDAFGLALVEYKEKRNKDGSITRVYRFR